MPTFSIRRSGGYSRLSLPSSTPLKHRALRPGCKLFLFCLLPIVVAVLLFFLLHYFNLFDIIPYLVAFFNLINSLFVAGPVVLFIPTCPDAVLAFDLQYDAASNTVQDISGMNCVVSSAAQTILAVGNDPTIGPFYSGKTSWSFNLPNCTSYTWLQWIRIDNGAGLNNRFMSAYSITPKGLFPLTALLYGQGFVTWAAFPKALPSEVFVHIAVAYDPTVPENRYYINGELVDTTEPYADPPILPYLSGVIDLNTVDGVLPNSAVYLGRTRLQCHTMSAMDVIGDAGVAFPSTIPLPYPLASVSRPSSDSMPSYKFPNVADASMYHAYFASFPTPASDSQVPRSLSSDYVTIYVDQVAGSDSSSSGISPGSGAWASTENFGIFGNLGFDFAILDQEHMFHSGLVTLHNTNDAQFPAGRTPPTFSQGVLPGGCNAWYFSNANTGQVEFTTITHNSGNLIHYSGGDYFRAIDATISLWLNIKSVTGSPTVGASMRLGDSRAEHFQITPYDAGHYQLVVQALDVLSVQLTTILPYSEFHFISFTWNCLLRTAHLYVDGVVVTTITDANVCPAGMYGDFAILLSDGGANTFTGWLGGLSMHLTSLSPSAIAAMYRLKTAGVCALVEVCLAVRFCANDRYFASPGLQFLQGSPECPFNTNSYDCGRGTYKAQISGASILPQTPQIGWQPVNYMSPTGVVHSDVLMYDLEQLYQLTGTQFLRSDPLAAIAGNYQAFIDPTGSAGGGTAASVYAPIGYGTMYSVARSPNIDSGRYPTGHLYSHTLKTLSFLTNGYDLQPGYYGSDHDPAYYAQNNHWMMTPGSWCNATFWEMFGGDQAKYYAFMTDPNKTALLEQAVVWNLPFTFDNIGASHFVYHVTGGAANVIDCMLWYNTEVANGSPTALNIPWSNPAILDIGVSPTNYEQPGFAIPQCYQTACVLFSEYYAQFDAPGPSAPPPFNSNPKARATGGYTNTAGAMLFNAEVLFDGPGEFIDKGGKMYVIPWDQRHRDALLDTSSGLGLDPINIAQNPTATEGWMRIVDLNTNVGVSLGYNVWQIQDPTTPTQGIIQGIEVSHFNRWGIRVETQLPSRVQDVALSYNLNHISLANGQGHAFVIGAIAVNTTRPWYGFNQDNDGIGVHCSTVSGGSPSSTCNVLDSEFITTWGASDGNFFRNVKFVDNMGQSTLYPKTSKFWIEHCLFNLTEQNVGDAGVIYTSPSPQVMLYSTMAGMMVSNNLGFDFQPTYALGSGKAGGAREFYLYGTSMVIHGSRLLDVIGDPVGLLDQGAGYESTSFFQLSSTEITGASWTIWNAGNIQKPTSERGARGRPFTILNCAFLYDGIHTDSIVQQVDYPVFGPGVQGGSPLWRWGNTNCPVDNGTWIKDIQMCYGMLEYSGDPNVKPLPHQLTYADGDGLKLPLGLTLSIANSIADWQWAVSNKNTPVGYGATHCANVKTTFEEQIQNEATYHYEATQPVIMAIARAQIPNLWLDNVGTFSSLGASWWEEPMSRYNPSTPWPSEDAEPSQHACVDRASCQPYLLTHVVLSLASGTWVDSMGAAVIAYTGFNGFGQFPALTPSYAGNVYDPDRGAVMDTVQAQGLFWEIRYPDLYLEFTVSFWMMVPTIQNVYNMVQFNRNTGTLLQMGGNNGLNSGGQIVVAGQGWVGQGGTAIPFLVNTAAQGCRFDADVNVEIDEGRVALDEWVHYTMAVSRGYKYSGLYTNGVLRNRCVAYGGGGVEIQPSYGRDKMPFMAAVSARVSDLRVYAGRMSDATVMSMYHSAQNDYQGPSSFPVLDSSTHKVIDVQWSSSMGTFVISPTETTWTVASLSQFSALVAPSSPDGSAAVVIAPNAQFSLPTPAGVDSWTLSLTVWWSAAPINQYWWHIPLPASSGVLETARIVIYADSTAGICLYSMVGPFHVLSNTANIGQSSCLSSASFPLGSFTTYTFQFNSATGSAKLLMGGGQLVGSFSGVFTGLLATTAALSFSIPSQVYYLANHASLNGGYIKGLQLFQSQLY